MKKQLSNKRGSASFNFDASTKTKYFAENSPIHKMFNATAVCLQCIPLTPKSAEDLSAYSWYAFRSSQTMHYAIRRLSNVLWITLRTHHPLIRGEFCWCKKNALESNQRVDVAVFFCALRNIVVGHARNVLRKIDLRNSCQLDWHLCNEGNELYIGSVQAKVYVLAN